MTFFNNKDFDILHCCPWCEEDRYKILYKDEFNSEIVKCDCCGIVYAKKRLNKTGLSKYWKNYLSRVHLHDFKAVEQRLIMYKIDYDFISKFKNKGNVLDVGCGNGSFMTIFENAGYNVVGVEYGQEAAEAASKNHNIICGEFPDLDIKNKFDLIIFRGVLQYVPNPKDYIDKAISLLNNNGCIFITAQPNIDSLCFKLFKDKFTQPVTGIDFIGYSELVLTKYFVEQKLHKIAEKYFYEETPYADIENDILKVANAINKIRNGEQIDFKSPAFYGNMMSLVYRKE